ncbi:hypothetical protein BJ684DRAFT_21838 [Piptocephalis cylindrospora]|uniref:Uncharacterized protein n=1 Tax=Piptocephalis cylindrospora TaxID=1907219 RepID=A0A4P9XYS1_9FUNG|nr:hypothetical protein BJ684DRAFT_21838 [Piptocephalis cylindrospora]|eukprot:RKP11585.1 hypothetical protein BJ684DRAFT_21838 [Piptocephalis cylindrospora]
MHLSPAFILLAVLTPYFGSSVNAAASKIGGSGTSYHSPTLMRNPNSGQAKRYASSAIVVDPVYKSFDSRPVTTRTEKKVTFANGTPGSKKSEGMQNRNIIRESTPLENQLDEVEDIIIKSIDNKRLYPGDLAKIEDSLLEAELKFSSTSTSELKGESMTTARQQYDELNNWVNSYKTDKSLEPLPSTIKTSWERRGRSPRFPEEPTVRLIEEDIQKVQDFLSHIEVR